MSLPAPAARDAMKRGATEPAVAEVKDGIVLGLGTASTAVFAIEAWAAPAGAEVIER